MKTIEIPVIRDRDRKRFPGRVLEGLSAEVTPGISVRVFGTYPNRINPEFTSRTIKIGDEAEYDSYNYRYTGKVVAITEKTVTIEKTDIYVGSRTRLTMYEFCRRNWDFDVEANAAHNFDVSQHI